MGSMKTVVSKTETLLPKTLLSRTALPFCITSMGTFVILNILIQINYLISTDPICNAAPVSYWVWLAQCLSAATFFSMIVLICSHIVVSGRASRGSPIDLRGIFLTELVIVIQAGGCSFFMVVWNWGGMCEDILGFTAPATQVIEWLTTVPLMIYIVLAISMYFMFIHHHIIGYTAIEPNVEDKNAELNASALTLIFLTVASDSHIELLYQSFITQQDGITRARQAFLRYVMHEVRVPLSSIAMGIDALSSMEEGEEDDNEDDNDEKEGFDETLSMMREASVFMGDTLNSILNMQKIEEGKLELHYSPFVVRNMIRKVQNTLKGLLKNKDISLIVSIGGDVAYSLIGDSFQIEHVLTNFLSNAIKFSSRGSSISIIISKENTDTASILKLNKESKSTSISSHSRERVMDDFMIVRFAVRDKGVGISLEDQNKLFKPFSQIRPGELQGGGGSGMGLSICKQIIELHGGNVSVRSKPGQGSTFSFVLPLSIAHVEPSSTSAIIGAIGGKSSAVSTPTSVDQIPSKIYKEISILHVEDCSNENKSNRISSHNNDNDSSHNNNNLIAINNSYKEDCSYINNNKDGISIKENDNNEDEDEDSKDNINVRIRGTIQKKYSSRSSLIFCENDETGRVLLVDDVTSNRKLLKLLIKRRKFDCYEAEDGAEAVALVASSPQLYDLIFMDNLMPNMDGCTASTRLRELGYNKLIIGLTGNAMEDDVETFLAAGADVVFTKPMKLEQLNMLFAHIQKKGNVTVGGDKLYVVKNGLVTKAFLMP
eukprot:gene1981-3856_t